jgi:hypothetical protein
MDGGLSTFERRAERGFADRLKGVDKRAWNDWHFLGPDELACASG